MSITTNFSGYLKRYDGTEVKLQERFSVTKTVTEYGNNKIIIANGSSDISIMPSGLTSAKSFYLDTDNKINVTVYGDTTASFDIYANGLCYMNASLSDVRLANRSATVDAAIIYDLSG